MGDLINQPNDVCVACSLYVACVLALPCSSESRCFSCVALLNEKGMLHTYIYSMHVSIMWVSMSLWVIQWITAASPPRVFMCVCSCMCVRVCFLSPWRLVLACSTTVWIRGESSGVALYFNLELMTEPPASPQHTPPPFFPHHINPLYLLLPSSPSPLPTHLSQPSQTPKVPLLIASLPLSYSPPVIFLFLLPCSIPLVFFPTKRRVPLPTLLIASSRCVTRDLGANASPKETKTRVKGQHKSVDNV